MQKYKKKKGKNLLLHVNQPKRMQQSKSVILVLCVPTITKGQLMFLATGLTKALFIIIVARIAQIAQSMLGYKTSWATWAIWTAIYIKNTILEYNIVNSIPQTKRT